MVTNQFYPRYRLINSITQAKEATVTFTADHDYTDGEIISFRCSAPFGMFEMNEQQGRVLSHTSNAVTVDVDTSGFTAFVYPASTAQYSPAMAVPRASGIIPNQDVATVNLQDAFDNRRVS